MLATMQTPPPIPQAGRPKSLTAAAVICFIFGAFGLFGLLGALMSLADVQFGTMPGTAEATKAMMNEPHVKALTVYGGFLNAAAGALLIAAGVGLLKCRNWARTVTILWSLYNVAVYIVSGYITSVYMMPLMQKMMEAQFKAQSGGKGMPSSDIASKMGSVMGTLSAVVGVLFAVAVGVTLIILVTRPKAKAACQPTVFS